MPDITIENLKATVKRYVDNNDVETAKAYVKSWGEVIQGYDVEKGLENLKAMIEGKATAPAKKEAKAAAKEVKAEVNVSQPKADANVDNQADKK